MAAYWLADRQTRLSKINRQKVQRDTPERGKWPGNWNLGWYLGIWGETWEQAAGQSRGLQVGGLEDDRTSGESWPEGRTGKWTLWRPAAKADLLRRPSAVHSVFCGLSRITRTLHLERDFDIYFWSVNFQCFNTYFNWEFKTCITTSFQPAEVQAPEDSDLWPPCNRSERKEDFPTVIKCVIL